MDRLPPVIAMVALLAACDGGEQTASKPPPPAPSRVDAVVAAPKKQVNTAEFCDSRPNKPFAMPALDGAAPTAGSGWRWVNVWATWCGPCVEEMPLIAGWETKLQGEGTNVDLQFMSVDASAEDVTKFKASHPTAPDGSRIQSLDLLSPWLKSVGLDDTAVLPLHLFVNPSGDLTCVRMGSVGDADYDTVKAVLSGQ